MKLANKQTSKKKLAWVDNVSGVSRLAPSAALQEAPPLQASCRVPSYPIVSHRIVYITAACDQKSLVIKTVMFLRCDQI